MIIVHNMILLKGGEKLSLSNIRKVWPLCVLYETVSNIDDVNQ